MKQLTRSEQNDINNSRRSLATKIMPDTFYYIGNRNEDGKLLIYCRNGRWKPYRECEQDWSQVLVMTSAKAYDFKDNQLMTKDDHYGFTNCQIHVRSNESQRMIYALLSFDETSDHWQVKGKCLAESWWDARRTFKVEQTESEHSFTNRVAHYSDLYRYDDGVLATIDAMKITH